MRNFAIGAARTFFLMILFDCLLLIYVNVDGSIEYIDLTYLAIELIVAAISLYATIKFFRKKGDGPLSVSDKVARVAMVGILFVMTFVMFAVFGSSHHVPVSTEIGYFSIFCLTFLATVYALRVK